MSTLQPTLREEIDRRVILGLRANMASIFSRAFLTLSQSQPQHDSHTRLIANYKLAVARHATAVIRLKRFSRNFFERLLSRNISGNNDESYSTLHISAHNARIDKEELLAELKKEGISTRQIRQLNKEAEILRFSGRMKVG